ncbi:MAG: serine/threonine-protein kinase [Actinomycetes bacterium]
MSGGSTSSTLAGRWELQRAIGSGAAGVLWAATDHKTYTTVAVKVARYAGHSFTDEARLQAQVDSPYVARVLDSGVVGDSGQAAGAYLVQELVPGVNLRDLLRSSTPHNVDVTAWAYGLLRALQSMAAEGIVHRDIKPSNVMIPLTAGGSPAPQPKLVDFGTAACGVNSDDDASSSGTVLYMSPEQARGSGVGTASDMYSLGLVLLECLTGDRAFCLPAIESLVARTLRNPVIPDTVPVFWQRLIRAMTSMDPALRPTPAEALAMLTGSEVLTGPDVLTSPDVLTGPDTLTGSEVLTGADAVSHGSRTEPDLALAV